MLLVDTGPNLHAALLPDSQPAAVAMTVTARIMISGTNGSTTKSKSASRHHRRPECSLDWLAISEDRLRLANKGRPARWPAYLICSRRWHKAWLARPFRAGATSRSGVCLE